MSTRVQNVHDIVKGIDDKLTPYKDMLNGIIDEQKKQRSENAKQREDYEVSKDEIRKAKQYIAEISKVMKEIKYGV